MPMRAQVLKANPSAVVPAVAPVEVAGNDLQLVQQADAYANYGREELAFMLARRDIEMEEQQRSVAKTRQADMRANRESEMRVVSLRNRVCQLKDEV